MLEIRLVALVRPGIPFVNGAAPGTPRPRRPGGDGGTRPEPETLVVPEGRGRRRRGADSAGEALVVPERRGRPAGNGT